MKRTANPWSGAELLDDLGDDDSRWVEYVFTKSPREVAEDIAEAEAAAPES